MSIDEIKKNLDYIEGIKDDDECAHSAEDALKDSFIAYIATLKEQPELQEKAKEILKVNDIDFCRWCA